MSEILRLLGFNYLETFQEFSLRFSNISTNLEPNLKKLWISHKENPQKIDFNSLKSVEQYEFKILLNEIKRKIDNLEAQSEVEFERILNEVVRHLNYSIAFYILSNCYLFYDWGENSLEIVFNHDQVFKKFESKEKLNSSFQLFQNISTESYTVQKCPQKLTLDDTKTECKYCKFFVLQYWPYFKTINFSSAVFKSNNSTTA